jgi:hypothetical protein
MQYFCRYFDEIPQPILSNLSESQSYVSFSTGNAEFSAIFRLIPNKRLLHLAHLETYSESGPYTGCGC